MRTKVEPYFPLPKRTSSARSADVWHLDSITRNMPAIHASYAEAFIAGIVNTQPTTRELMATFAKNTAARTKPVD
ncbi:MAG: Methylthioacryloyl-CoA hydratase [Nitrospira sp.]|nr:Methylthioacryloyl-CoA hydratase [Nitrospira sp.]